MCWFKVLWKVGRKGIKQFLGKKFSKLVNESRGDDLAHDRANELVTMNYWRWRGKLSFQLIFIDFAKKSQPT